jgi:hypothetical protein
LDVSKILLPAYVRFNDDIALNLADFNEKPFETIAQAIHIHELQGIKLSLGTGTTCVSAVCEEKAKDALHHLEKILNEAVHNDTETFGMRRQSVRHSVGRTSFKECHNLFSLPDTPSTAVPTPASSRLPSDHRISMSCLIDERTRSTCSSEDSPSRC